MTIADTQNLLDRTITLTLDIRELPEYTDTRILQSELDNRSVNLTIEQRDIIMYVET